jgi:hypothetical protein
MQEPEQKQEFDDEYIVIDTHDFCKFIYEVNINEKIDQSSMRAKSDNNDKYTSYIDFINYINENKNAYKDSVTILQQFKLDFVRLYLELNQEHIDDMDLALATIEEKLKNYGYYESIFNMSFNDLIILLCCQSSFALPYTILENIYEFNNDNKVLASGSKNKISTNIKINIDDKNIYVILNSILNVKETKYMGKIIQQIDITISFDFQKNMNKNEPQFCVFTWSMKPNNQEENKKIE